MKKIEIIKTTVADNKICYQVREEKGLGLLQQDVVDLFIRFHGDENFDCDLNNVPLSILQLPISLYLVPITFFYNVELVIPEMDKVLYDRLPAIYDAYSKIYGPFKEEWRGKITVQKIVKNTPVKDAKYDKIVFFSGGVDACHAGINNPGRRSLLVSIPDIEKDAKNDGLLREEKFALIKSFSNVVNSDWLLISNNFNACLYNYRKIESHLGKELGLCSTAYKHDGWGGIRYLANMCCVAPIVHLAGVKILVMGSGFSQIEDDMRVNYDGANPELTNSIVFEDTVFAEQDGLMVRRSKKVSNIIDWCKKHNVTTKMWVCFRDDSVQCGYCGKCVRTQLNILCAGENPKDWGFENFSEKQYTKHIKSFRYVEGDPCFLWDNIETINENKTYPYCNELLHWLKAIGYKQYSAKSKEYAIRRAKFSKLKLIASVHRYPHYLYVIISSLFGKK
ncbi:hypothetical protein [Xylanibacter brevis]|uniref:hypothetical protein n=1 Tax=Xylanibacter brevis TaxID=83231 RepID=UPI00048110F7|nr:hypothetical protein [Xylanibacter brevis]